MNLCVGDIFRNSNKFSTVAEQAIHLVSFFNRSTFFLGCLRSEQLALYRSYVSFVLPNCTRWNSHYLCFASIFRTCAALKNLATKIEEGNDEDLNDFSEILLTYISNNECFGWVCQVIKNLSDSTLKDYLITKLEKRWLTWKQLLLLLSFLLYPFYRTTQFNQNIDNLSFAHMGRWIIYYYKNWFNKFPNSILSELQYYESQEYLFNQETFNQFGSDVLKYWNFCKEIAPELHLVAVQIFSVCITTASVKRLFSTMG
ncbi:14547_t:CDS:2, partial [Cetraspora pellucida]